ncbi:hypothetical protein KY311_02850 [Candidatus Woesearchaeota archaeon]|nr:hypothetical protein [Candidatus Woesearchaeota archaeon]
MLKRGSKGQAATEFIMTYGWAILVVIVAIAALAYFGVLSPENFLPEKCIFPPGIACLDNRVTTDTVQLYLQNTMGYDISITEINLTDKGCVYTTPFDLVNGDNNLFNINCSSGTSGAKFKSDIRITYLSAVSNVTHTKIGNLITKVE